MKKFRTSIKVACIVASTLIVSCHTERQFSSPSLSYNRTHNPNFIDDITLGNNSNGISMNLINRSNRVNEQAQQIQPSLANTLQKKYAYILGVLPQAITNLPLYRFIDEWYGVRYRLGGNDKSGIDCSAFAQRLYEEVFGTSLLRTAIEQFTTTSLVKNISKLKEGDLVFFHIHSRHITHVGIYLMNNYFVHASASQGVTISNLNDGYWQRFFAGAGEMPRDNG